MAVNKPSNASCRDVADEAVDGLNKGATQKELKCSNTSLPRPLRRQQFSNAWALCTTANWEAPWAWRAFHPTSHRANTNCYYTSKPTSTKQNPAKQLDRTTSCSSPATRAQDPCNHCSQQLHCSVPPTSLTTRANTCTRTPSSLTTECDKNPSQAKQLDRSTSCSSPGNQSLMPPSSLTAHHWHTTSHLRPTDATDPSRPVCNADHTQR